MEHSVYASSESPSSRKANSDLFRLAHTATPLIPPNPRLRVKRIQTNTYLINKNKMINSESPSSRKANSD